MLTNYFHGAKIWPDCSNAKDGNVWASSNKPINYAKRAGLGVIRCTVSQYTTACTSSAISTAVANAAAIDAARRIQQQGSKPARWIAADALRELGSAAVQGRLHVTRSIKYA